MNLLTRLGLPAVMVGALASASLGSPATVLAAPGTLVRAAAPTGLVGQGDRQAAIDGYIDTLLPALDTPVEWNGSESSCRAGTPQPAEQQSTLAAINYMRSLVGVQPVTLSPAMSAEALQTATMMLAQGELSHTPASDFACYTFVGAATAGRSNLYLGKTGAAAIAGYMVDPGDNNTRAGHRRWVIDPRLRTMGSGSTSGSNALYVINHDDLGLPADPLTTPSWLPWPSAGFFPAGLEPQGRWSLSAADPSVNFSSATVSMVGPDGPVALTVNARGAGPGPTSVVWDLAGQLPASGVDRRYTVSVSGVSQAGVAVPPVTYDVVLVPVKFSQVSPPALSGEARPGQSLSVSTGVWRPAPQDVSIDWQRDGKPITGYDDSASYPVSKWDAGRVISARVTISREGLSKVTVRTAEVKVGGLPLIKTNSRPDVQGVPRVGSALKATTGRFTPTPTAVGYRWLRDGRTIKGAKGRTYRVVAKDGGHKLKVRVTARRAGFSTLIIRSKALRIRG